MIQSQTKTAEIKSTNETYKAQKPVHIANQNCEFQDQRQWRNGIHETQCQIHKIYKNEIGKST